MSAACPGRWACLGLGTLIAVAWLLAGCTDPPPSSQHDLCRIFEQRPAWYDYARRTEARWGTPVAVQMAFVQLESSFRSRARPPRRYLLGILPWRWQSTAYGYAQAKDGTWRDYLRANPGPFRKRSDMEDALDFIGWYNHQSTRRLGLAPNDAYTLYLAYHEGWTGYRRGDWRREGPVRAYAARVAKRARAYAGQLAQCRQRLRCGRWYQVWPFCRQVDGVLRLVGRCPTPEGTLVVSGIERGGQSVVERLQFFEFFGDNSRLRSKQLLPMEFAFVEKNRF